MTYLYIFIFIHIINTCTILSSRIRSINFKYLNFRQWVWLRKFYKTLLKYYWAVRRCKKSDDENYKTLFKSTGSIYRAGWKYFLLTSCLTYMISCPPLHLTLGMVYSPCLILSFNVLADNCYRIYKSPWIFNSCESEIANFRFGLN